MSENRTNDTLIAYDKNGNVIAQGIMGDGSVVIDNLKPATSYSAGDFMVAFSNKNGVSDKVAVPAFETKSVPNKQTQPASSTIESTSPASSQAGKPVSSASQPTEAQPASSQPIDSSASEVESEKSSQASSAESASSNSAQPASQAK